MRFVLPAVRTIVLLFDGVVDRVLCISADVSVALAAVPAVLPLG